MPLIAVSERDTLSGIGDVDDISITTNTNEELSQISFDDYVNELTSGKFLDRTKSEIIREWSPQKSFCAESPYFDAFVEKEMQSMEYLSDLLDDIGNKTTEFAAAGAAMAKATRNLSLSCRLKTTETNNKRNNVTDPEAVLEKNRRALGSEMAPVFERFGEVLERIASVQEKMCKELENVLGSNLRKIAGNNVKIANDLKDEAVSHTEKAERMFFKYLNGNQAGGNFGDILNTGSVSNINPNGSTSSSNKPTFRSTLTSTTARQQRGLAFLSFRGRPMITETVAEMVENEEGDHKLAMAKKLAQWQHTMEEISVEWALAELSRFQLFKYLVGTKHQRPFELCQKTADAVRAIHEYHTMCSSLLSCIEPCVQLSEVECKDKQLNHQRNEQPVWLEREGLIIEALTMIKDDALDASKQLENMEKTPLDPATIDIDDLNIDEKERSTGIWNMFEKLASCSQFPRMSPPGVLLEGWLYQQKSGLLQSAWTKRWFILKKDGIHYLQISTGYMKSAEISKIKICDIVLCSVRESKDKPQARFSFELISSNQKPIVLQARGPKEYRRWVDAIRDTIGGQLAVVDSNSKELKHNIGHLVRGCSEIDETVKWRGNSIHSTNSSQFKDLLLADLSESARSEFSTKSHDDYEGVDAKDLVKKAMKNNPTCADCAAGSPGWVSLNLGILVCLECSGVHRSLGVHVSKVRSLDLDSLNHAEASLLFVLGNERMNEIYEKEYRRRNNKPSGFLKNQAQREEWIKDKYLTKKFLTKNIDNEDPRLREERLSLELYQAAKNGNVIGVASALADGAYINWKNPNEGGKTAYQISSVVNERKFIEPRLRRGLKVCSEFLAQNGANVIAAVEDGPDEDNAKLANTSGVGEEKKQDPDKDDNEHSNIVKKEHKLPRKKRRSSITRLPATMTDSFRSLDETAPSSRSHGTTEQDIPSKVNKKSRKKNMLEAPSARSLNNNSENTNPSRSAHSRSTHSRSTHSRSTHSRTSIKSKRKKKEKNVIN